MDATTLLTSIKTVLKPTPEQLERATSEIEAMDDQARDAIAEALLSYSEGKAQSLNSLLKGVRGDIENTDVQLDQVSAQDGLDSIL